VTTAPQRDLSTGVGRTRATRLLVTSLLLLVSSQAAAQGELPWSVGVNIQGLGVLERIQRHPEYVRTQWRDEGVSHRIEVVPRSDDADPWGAGPYRVQPAPGAKSDAGALSALRAHLVEVSARPGHVPFVGLARGPTSPQDALDVPTSRGDTPYPPTSAPWLLLLLVCAVGAALVAFVRSRLAGSRDRSLAVRGITLSLCAGLGVLMLLDPASLDPSLITILHEGNTEHVTRALWGSGHHGPLWDAARWGVSSLGGYEELLPIRVIVTLNLALATLNVIGLTLAARLVVGQWPVALLVGLTVLVSPLFLNGALSELTAQLIFTLCLAMAAALGAMERSRTLALFALVSLTVALGLTRAEWALAGGLVCLAAVAVPYFEARPPGPRSIGPIVAFALGAAAFWGAPLFVEAERATYLSQGLTPTDWAPVAMPIVYAMGLGLGLLVLGLVGAIKLLSKGAWIGVPLALVLLARMYTEASHRGQAPYESLRYGQLMLPVLVGCSLVGWRAVLHQTRWTGRSRAVLIATLSILHVAPLGGHVARAVFPHHHLASEPLYEAPLDRDQQREARALIELIEESSVCVAVAVSARDPKPTDPIEGWDYIFFGGPLAGPLTAERDPGRLPAHLKSLGSPRCARFFSGLDCHVEGYEGCERERAMGTPDAPKSAALRPYYDHLTRGAQAGLQVVRWGSGSAP
jgi:hypothetical protein